MSGGLDCKAISRLLSEAQDRSLSDVQREALERHLLLCQACRNVEAQFDQISKLLKAMGDSLSEGSDRGGHP